MDRVMNAMKENRLTYEEPFMEVYVIKTGNVITLSQGDPLEENIGYDSWDGNW